MSKTSFKHLVSMIAVLAGALALVACTTKNRDTRLTQGQKLDGLLSVKDYQHKEYPIQTFEALTGETSIYGSSDKMISTKKNVFPVVRYETEAPFLKAIGNKKWALIGRENTKGVYSFFLQLTDKLLVVYKKGKAADLTESEKSIGTVRGEFVLVPQFSMNIKLKKVEALKNADAENTNIKSLFDVTSLADAQYFDVDLASVKMAHPASRDYVFEKKFFEGEWFFSAVVVQSQETPEGANLAADFALGEASRIKWQIEQNRLVGKNVNVDTGEVDEASGRVALEMADVIYIPSKSVDYALETAPSNVPVFKEEILAGGDARSLPWKDRKYLILDFNNAFGVASLMSKTRMVDNDATLIDLTVDDNYIGFTVFYGFSKQTIRYSMKRAHKAIQGRIAFAPDMDKKFGYFTTQKAFVPGPEHVRHDDFTKNIFINRFYPSTNKDKPNTIVFHFSTSTPKEPAMYREAARDAVKKWSALFEKTSKITVEIDESMDVDLGDVRYNVINMIYEKKDSGGLLGYGPSISDTLSGEIVAATANIYVTPFKNIAVQQLRTLVYREIGRIGDEKILDPATLTQKLAAELAGWNYTSEPLSYILDRNEKIKLDQGQKPNADGTITSCHSFDLSYRETQRVAAEKCQDDLFAYIQRLRDLNKDRRADDLITVLPSETGAGGESRNPEYEALSKCADKVAQDNIVATLLHELGHNFGLRHNFAASADLRNFNRDFTKSTQKERSIEAREKLMSSSVMDYLSASAKDTSELGPYDEAVIRFGYAGEVEVESATNALGDFTNQFVKLNTNVSLAENERNQSVKFRNYKFCTDEQVTNKYGFGNYSDESLCFRHDWGATAAEVAYNLVNDVNFSMNGNRHRFDLIRARFRDSDKFKAFINDRYLEPLLRIYAEWRLMLAKEIKDRTKINLLGLTETELKEIIQRGLQNPDPIYRDRFADFYAASQLIGNFILKTSMLPARQCLVWDAQNNLHTEDFERLKEIATLNQAVLKDCDDPQVPVWMKVVDQANAPGIVVRGAGFNFNDHTFSQEVKERADWWTADIIGVGDFVTASAELLRDADTFSTEFQNMKLSPAILQEPEILKQAAELIRERLLFGIKAVDLIPEYQDKTVYLPLFRSTLDSTMGLINAVRTTLKSQESVQDAWSRKFNYSMAGERSEIPVQTPVWSLSENTHAKYRFASLENTFAIEFIRKYSELDNLERLTVATVSQRLSSESVRDKALALANELQQKLAGDVKSISVANLAAEYASLRTKYQADPVMTRVLNEMFRSLFENPKTYSLVEASDTNGMAQMTQTLEQYLSGFNSPIPQGSIVDVTTNFVKRWSHYIRNREEMRNQQKQLQSYFNTSGFGE